MQQILTSWRARLLFALLVASAAASAQSSAARAGSWAIPERGVAEFVRTAATHYFRGVTPESGKQLAQSKLFGPLRKPALLFAGELDKAGARIEHSPTDLRELLPWLALDLSTVAQRGYRTVLVPRVHSFGDVRVRLSVSKLAADGSQDLTARVTSVEARPQRSEDPDYVKTVVHGFAQYRLDGQLSIRRQVDLAAGVVRGFEARLEAGVDAAPDDDSGDKLQLAESWRLARLRANRDAEFVAAVHAAIDKGAAWIQTNAAAGKAKHTDKAQPKHPAKSSDSGRLALALMALVHAGVPHDDPGLLAGYAELRRRKIEDSYSLACAIMAIESLYAPANERANLREGLELRPRVRKLSAKDLELVRSWAATLVGNVDTRVDRRYLLRFNYTAGRSYDNSVHQYGLLGLYAAHLCGVEQDVSFWHAAATHTLQEQQDAVRSVTTRTVSSRDYQSTAQWQRARQQDRTRSASQRRVRVAGWGYRKPGRGAHHTYGSMTVAGITALALCESALRLHGADALPILAKCARARASGFAWLDQSLGYCGNPRMYKTHQSWTYYYLYGLERACELSHVALIGDRDWYFEGACTLLAWQDEHGAFARPVTQVSSNKAYGWPLEDTCFAVLFLAKESLPVLTGGR